MGMWVSFEINRGVVMGIFTKEIRMRQRMESTVSTSNIFAFSPQGLSYRLPSNRASHLPPLTKRVQTTKGTAYPTDLATFEFGYLHDQPTLVSANEGNVVPFDQGSQESFATPGPPGFDASFGQDPPGNERTATSGGFSGASAAFALAQAQIHNPPPLTWNSELHQYLQGYTDDWDPK
ncbi:hypothetical protein QFC20_007583 [Naganishia adeliensis]|uniref:Uncharacterized protein n=1 Tax=Naganishia adeliensis TaxID=92952 RepID=A0ACC2UXI7_9TREE|nr:hypothetical protein QFC20_007583 [Naganishia adeliensis]